MSPRSHAVRFLLTGPALLLVLALACAPSATPVPAASQASQASQASTPVPAPARPDMVLATTTSTVDSGLLDGLIPLFEQQTGYRVKTLSLGSGQAMAVGERGEADVLLVHSPAAEVAFMAAGHGSDRHQVMYNDIVLLAPPSDPAGVTGLPAPDALRQIAAQGAIFISRGDNSGTHALERRLWDQAGIDPAGRAWYQETGQGMGATLQIAGQKAAYTLADRGTWLAQRHRLPLVIAVERDPALVNQYHVITVHPAGPTGINADGAAAFARFLLDPATQERIGQFGVERFGMPLFFPNAVPAQLR